MAPNRHQQQMDRPTRMRNTRRHTQQRPRNPTMGQRTRPLPTHTPPLPRPTNSRQHQPKPPPPPMVSTHTTQRQPPSPLTFPQTLTNNFPKETQTQYFL